MISKKQSAFAISATLGMTLVLSGCTTDGGVTASQSTQDSGATVTPSQTPTPEVSATTTSTQSGATVLPVVSGANGKEPTLAAPQGTPPADLVVKDIYPGTGTVVSATSTLTVQYTLMAWSTGKIVETSWTGGTPATFPLSGVISGWQKGLPGMKAGGRRLLVIPPADGYGASGSGPIGANETLIFVVDLISVK